jgi:type IV pilus assembly protein PilV
MIRRYSASPAGFALIEVLVTAVLLTIGLLGLAGLQAKTSVAEMEAYQRAQALILAQDMADRIAANKASAASYVAADYGTGPVQSCTGTLVQLDTCNWGNAIRGASEKSGTVSVGTLLGGRGCIINPATNQYAVVVVWQGLAATVAPSVICGQNSYGAEKLRRAVVVPIRIADLNAT